ncbi:hypothetical protein [Marinicella sp. W31]|uniref:hypothetical protein n=1 Tax=Marinicella sp. W31 TaxID=3023713 RepID=UPI003756E3EC
MADPPHSAFFQNLKKYCGQHFSGTTVFPEEPSEDFRNKTLIAKFQTCSDDEIRIPFEVGNNTSRTWIISLSPQGLQLKHDHRHADGSPDEITMYGGINKTPGTARKQSFPADSHTAELIPDAATNEWFLSLSEDGNTLTYYLERHSKPRFKAILTRQK